MQTMPISRLTRKFLDEEIGEKKQTMHLTLFDYKYEIRSLNADELLKAKHPAWKYTVKAVNFQCPDLISKNGISTLADIRVVMRVMIEDERVYLEGTAPWVLAKKAKHNLH